MHAVVEYMLQLLVWKAVFYAKHEDISLKTTSQDSDKGSLNEHQYNKTPSHIFLSQHHQNSEHFIKWECDTAKHKVFQDQTMQTNAKW